jgi:hypothetical protein
MRIGLTSVDFPSAASASPRADGQFSITEIVPGEYVLSVSDLPEDVYVRDARLGTVDALENSLQVQNESPAPLQILLDSGGARIAATVVDRDNRPFAQARVVLVPDAARRHRPDQYKVVSSDEAGRAMIRGIPPGEYKLFAWEVFEPNAYLNKDYMRGYEDLGFPVRVKSGEGAEVAVRTIPPEY